MRLTVRIYVVPLYEAYIGFMTHGGPPPTGPIVG